MKIGVYVLMLNGKPVYVGSTENWPNRLVQHKEIEFDECRLIECPFESLRQIESRIIRLLKPKHNRQYLYKVPRYPVKDWVMKNQDAVKIAFETGEEARIGQIVKKELNYSQKTAPTDVAWSILRHYNKLNNVEFDRDRRKFKKIKRSPLR